MPFEKGNQLSKGIGRKGWEFETEQMKRMSRLLNSYLTLMEKVESGKATKNQVVAFERLKVPAMKIMDKLHASKTDWKVDFEKPLLVKKLK